jgi:hypothetical protein
MCPYVFNGSADESSKYPDINQEIHDPPHSKFREFIACFFREKLNKALCGVPGTGLMTPGFRKGEKTKRERRKLWHYQSGKYGGPVG